MLDIPSTPFVGILGRTTLFEFQGGSVIFNMVLALNAP